MSPAVAARVRRLVTVACMALTIAFTGAATANAHAELVSVSPGDGMMLTSFPNTVELTFSEAIGRPADVTVLGPDNAPLPVGELTIVDATATLTLASSGPAAAGWYTISYQVTSVDGHLIGGTSTFMVHPSGDTAMPVGAAGPAGGNDPDAGPWAVGALIAGLAVALIVALGAARRLLVRVAPT